MEGDSRSSSEDWMTPEQAARALAEGDGAGVKVAILDSGVEVSHPALAGLALADDLAIVRDATRLHVVDGNGVDVFGHGTAIAGIIRQLAPAAHIGSFRILCEGLSSRSDIVSAGAWQALKRGYHILNCSFGCRGEARFIMSYKSWVDEAYLQGAHIVAACDNRNFQIPEWPGHFPTVITVNLQHCEPGELFFRRGTLVEFAASGFDVTVPWRNNATKKVTGSSYAAPHVSGLIARLLSLAPGLPPLLLKDLLHRIAKPVEAAP
jgi:subtilisin